MRKSWRARASWFVHGAWISKGHDEGRGSGYRENTRKGETGYNIFLESV